MKVVIIGAGPAGLTAGLELLKKSNCEVIILEESNEIGGISKTVNYKGNRIDIGGHRFFSKDKRVLEFWEDIMPIQGKPSYDDKKLKIKKDLPLNGPDPELNDKVMLKRNRISRIYYLKKFFNYPIEMNFKTIKNLGFLNTISVGFSYIKSVFIKKKEDSLENFYINRFGKKLYSMFFLKYTEKVWGRTPKEISADWGVQRVKGLSIYVVIKNMFKKLFHIKSKNVETSLIEQFLYPKYGPGQLWEEVAKKFEQMGGTILKKHKVTKVTYENGKILSVFCKDKEFIADIFISSMPLKDLIESMKNVPNEINYVASNLPYRDFITIGLLVKKINLKNETKIKTLGNIIPDCWIYVQDETVKLNRIQIFNNWSPYLVKDKKSIWLGLEYCCNENDVFFKYSDKKLTEFAIDELLKMELINKKDVITSHVEKIKKAYPAYFDTYSEIDKLINYLNSFDNLYCIGRNGQHRYNNMDHSMITAFETVNNIVNNIKTKDNIWNVNTEKIYSEEKNVNF